MRERSKITREEKIKYTHTQFVYGERYDQNEFNSESKNHFGRDNQTFIWKIEIFNYANVHFEDRVIWSCQEIQKSNDPSNQKKKHKKKYSTDKE